MYKFFGTMLIVLTIPLFRFRFPMSMRYNTFNQPWLKILWMIALYDTNRKRTREMLPLSRSMRNVIDLPFSLAHDGLRAWKLVRKLIKRFNLQRSARKREKEGKETRVANYNTPRSNLGEKVPRSIKSLAFTFREIFYWSTHVRK